MAFDFVIMYVKGNTIQHVHTRYPDKSLVMKIMKIQKTKYCTDGKRKQYADKGF